MKTIVFDLDGTLADITHRLHFIKDGNHDWDGFFAACVDDAPIPEMVALFQVLERTNLMLQRSPNVKAIMGTATAHLQEHLAYQYRKEIERQMGVQLPPEDQELPAEVEVKLSGMVSEAARKLLKKNQAEAQQKKIQEQMQDPVLQLQKQDADTKAKEVDRKADADQLRAKTAGEATASKERIEGAKMGVQIAESQMEIASEEKIAGAELGVEIAKSTEQTASEERKTALQVGTQVANTILNLLGKERGGNNK